ncbi:hypothetical protein [Paenibacillus sp. NPDC057967]|uniref:hypothetical protein n=1 Tax=Paenibacillus sp. NPDC057967 TaxID=3346293 RepID=UPI0036DAF64C
MKRSNSSTSNIRLRFVLINGLYRVTILDSANWTCFIEQPPFFCAVTGVPRNKVLGTVRVTADHLLVLTGIPVDLNRKEVVAI